MQRIRSASGGKAIFNEPAHQIAAWKSQLGGNVTFYISLNSWPEHQQQQQRSGRGETWGRALWQHRAQIKYWPSPAGASLRACARVMAWIYKRSVFIFRTHARRGISALVGFAVVCVCVWGGGGFVLIQWKEDVHESGAGDLYLKHTHTHSHQHRFYPKGKQGSVNWDLGSAIVCFYIKQLLFVPSHHLGASGGLWGPLVQLLHASTEHTTGYMLVWE